MPGLNVRRIVIGFGLTVVAAGTFAFGLAASDVLRPMPVVIQGASAAKIAGETPRRFSAADMPAEPQAPARAISMAETTAKFDGVKASGQSLALAAEHIDKPRPAASPVVTPEPIPPASVANLVSAPAAPAPPVAVSSGQAPGGRRLGLLGDVTGLPEAVAAIDRTGGETAKALDIALGRIASDRSDPEPLSDLADLLAQAGHRPAAVTIANRGMMAARSQQNGEVLTRLTRQLAQLELAQAQPETARAAASARAQPEPAPPRPAPPRLDASTDASPEKLSDALDVALRDNAAADALAILQQMADGSIRRGDFAAAQKAYSDALAIAHTRQMTEARADQYANLGRMFWKKGDKGEAVAYWRAARDQYEQFEVPAKVADMNSLLRQASPTAATSPSRPSQSGKKTSSIIELR